ncbi:MAG: division/cell wall cluster transcriptional repressor MraZ, partial [Clostridia bacterium]
IDAKGRTFLPSKLRDGLSECFYIAKGNDPCICLYSEEEWEKLTERFNAMPSVQRRHLQRFFYSSADKQSLDTQGRFTLSPEFRKYAGIEKDAVIVGNNNVIEIWSLDGWENEQQFLDSENVTNQLLEMGF